MHTPQRKKSARAKQAISFHAKRGTVSSSFIYRGTVFGMVVIDPRWTSCYLALRNRAVAKIRTITFLALIWLTPNLAGTAVLAADESPESVPGLVPAGVKSLEGGWKEWTGITGDHELITSLSIDGVGNLWVAPAKAGS